jgi:hypothetical protein
MWQRIAPAERESMLRFRAAMLAAIAPHQSEIGTAVGQYATSSQLDRDALVATIDGILTPDQRKQVALAANAYFADLSSRSEQAAAEMQREFPNTRPNRPEPPPGAVGMSVKLSTGMGAPSSGDSTAADAGKILANWLFTPRTRPIENMTFSQFNSVTPFQMHVPGDAVNRAGLRDAVLGALTADQRSRVAAAIGTYAVSPDLDQAVLAKQLDILLSPPEQKQILAAYAAFAAAQKASLDEMQARFEAMTAQLPPDSRPPMAWPTRTVADAPEDGDPGMVLAKALLTQPMTVQIKSIDGGP